MQIFLGKIIGGRGGSSGSGGSDGSGGSGGSGGRYNKKLWQSVGMQKWFWDFLDSAYRDANGVKKKKKRLSKKFYL